MNKLAEIYLMMKKKRLNKWKELGGKVSLREWDYKSRVSTGISCSRRILDEPVINSCALQKRGCGGNDASVSVGDFSGLAQFDPVETEPNVQIKSFGTAPAPGGGVRLTLENR